MIYLIIIGAKVVKTGIVLWLPEHGILQSELFFQDEKLLDWEVYQEASLQGAHVRDGENCCFSAKSSVFCLTVQVLSFQPLAVAMT